MTEFKLTKDIDGDLIACECCYNELPVFGFNDCGVIKMLCSLCSSIYGKASDPINKSMLTGAIHWLLEELRKENNGKA